MSKKVNSVECYLPRREEPRSEDQAASGHEQSARVGTRNWVCCARMGLVLKTRGHVPWASTYTALGRPSYSSYKQAIMPQHGRSSENRLANGGLAHYVIAAAAVASHNVKHAWVLAWVASRFAASSCALRFSHFSIVLLFSWTKFFTKAKSWCLLWCTSCVIRYISISVYRLPLSSGPQFSRNASVRGP